MDFIRGMAFAFFVVFTAYYVCDYFRLDTANQALQAKNDKLERENNICFAEALAKSNQLKELELYCQPIRSK
jgi:hypothetical protein